MNRRQLALRLLAIAALLTAMVWTWSHRAFFNPHLLESEVRRFGPLAPVWFIGLYAIATVLFMPGSALTVAGGVLFGPVWGALWSLVGATLGATMAFLVARYVASDWVRKRTGERLARLVRGVEDQGWRFVAFARLVPLFPFNLVNYAFGLTRISLAQYVTASFVCMAPGAIAYAYLGYAGRQAAAGSAGTVRYGVIALSLLAAVALLPRIVRGFRGKYSFIDADELRRRLGSKPETVILDVRTGAEFHGPLGRIPGAVNLPLDRLASQCEVPGASCGDEIVLLCKSDRRSAIAAARLREQGYERVFVLRGGMDQWRRCGFPVEGANHD